MHSWSEPCYLFWAKGTVLKLKFGDSFGTHLSTDDFCYWYHVNVLDIQWLYRLSVEEVPEDDYMLPLSEAEVCNLVINK